MAKVCYLIFIFTSSVLALVNCQRDLPPPCSSSSLVSNSSCSQIIYGMIDCISFLGTGASVAKPDGSCCSGFKSVLKANGHCICQAVKDAPQMGIELNMTRATELPSACGVSHFSVSKICGFSDSPGTVASDSPGTAPPAKSPKPSPKTPTPVLKKAPAPSPLPSTKNHTLSPPTVPTPKSPKSPGPSLPKSKNKGEGFSQVSAPAPTNLNSGSYSLNSLNVSFATVFSICIIYLLLPLFEI